MTIILIIALTLYVMGCVVKLIWERNIEDKVNEIENEIIKLKARICKLEDTMGMESEE